MDDLKDFLLCDILDTYDTITCNLVKNDLTLADLYRLEGYVKGAIADEKAGRY